MKSSKPHVVGRRPIPLAGAVLVAGALVTSGCGLRVAEPSPTAVALTQHDQGAGTASGVAAPGSQEGSAVVAPGASPDGGGSAVGTSTGTTASTSSGGVVGTTTGAATGSSGAGGPSAGNDSGVKGGIAISGPSSQGVSATDVKFGVLAPISGAAGFLGQNQVDGINGYLGTINAKGGIGGRKFKTVVVDTQFDPASEATGARQLVEQQKVFAMLGVLGDSPAPYVTSKGIPNVVLGITPPAYSSKYPTTYPVTLNTVQSVVGMAQYLKQIKKAPINSVSILYDTQNMNVKPWLRFMEKAWTLQGVTVKSSDPFNLSDANCDQVVTRVKNLNVDFWQAGQSLGWPICLAAAARQGYKPSQGIGGPYSADAKFVGGAGQGSDGVYAQMNGVQIRINRGQPYPADPSGRAPEVDNYVNSMNTFAPNSSDMASLENIWTQDAWAMAKLLVEAVSKQTQAVTWKGVNQYIQSLTSWKSGLIQPISFKPTCKTGAEPWIFQWKRQADGTLVESDWKPYGGPTKIPDSIKNALAPGAGACYVTAMADAGLK